MLHKTTKPDLKTSQVISMIQSDIALANKKPLVEVFYQRCAICSVCCAFCEYAGQLPFDDAQADKTAIAATATIITAYFFISVIFSFYVVKLVFFVTT